MIQSEDCGYGIWEAFRATLCKYRVVDKQDDRKKNGICMKEPLKLKDQYSAVLRPRFKLLLCSTALSSRYRGPLRIRHGCLWQSNDDDQIVLHIITAQPGPTLAFSSKSSHPLLQALEYLS